MRDDIRWLVVRAIVLVVIGMIAYARGPEHHRGDDSVRSVSTSPSCRSDAS